jgi:Reverse transcriptase (RNA-dependent DNA polymerase)
MFVGYINNHASNVYQLLTLGKLSLILSRNVTWLNKCYGIFKHLKDTEILVLPATDEESYDDQEPEPNIKGSYEAKSSTEWQKWWEAMCTEFKNMEEKKVWKIYKKTEIPSGRKLIGNRWVYALKDDGRYRARTVAKGFSQIPGQDFQENFAPVVNDTTFHLALVLKILFHLDAGQFDIETAFLYGELDEEIWMELPYGYSEYVKDKHNNPILKDTHVLNY